MATTLDIQTPRRYLDPKSEGSFFPMMGCFQVTVPTVQKPIKTSQNMREHGGNEGDKSESKICKYI